MIVKSISPFILNRLARSQPALLPALALCLTLTSFALPSSSLASPANTSSCSAVFNVKPRTEAENWQLAIQAVNTVTRNIHGSGPFVEVLLANMIAREFVWLNGDPGGAKTLISRQLFEAALRSIPEKEKRVFVLQFHKLLNEGVITGFPKIKSLLDKGQYEINTETSLVGDRFLFLIADEAEKANPATLNALLSVLNERKALLGSKVVNAALSSGVFTSNKTMGEFLEAFGDDRPTGEALADRMTAKLHVPNQSPQASDKVDLYTRVSESRSSQGRQSAQNIEIPLKTLQNLLKQIQIEPAVFTDLAEVAFDFDALITDKTDTTERKIREGEGVAPYFPANQFSNRSMVKAPMQLKAAYLAHQIMMGRSLSDIPRTISRKDIHLLASYFAYSSVSRVRPKRLPLTEIKGIENSVPEFNLRGEWDPYNNILYVVNPLSGSSTAFSVNRSERTFTAVGPSSLQLSTEGLFEKISAAENGTIDLNVVEYELDSALDQLLAKQTLPARTRTELMTIQEDQQALTALLSAQVQKPARSVNTSLERRAALKRIADKAQQLKRDLRKARSSPQALQAALFDSIRPAFVELSTKFPDADHYIKATMTSLSASNHVYAFGPPGGAKTMIARLILDSEIKYVNKQEWITFTQAFLKTMNEKDPKALTKLLHAARARDPKRFDKYFLQFHKLLPEGRISGFPKLQEQIDSGRLEYNFDDSLAARKFMVAILDEVDKANPAVLTALLSVLNEREVFAGSQVYKAGLLTAVLTSNKMPSELRDSFGDDMAAADALLDRVLNKVYVSNKFSDADQLAQFLYDVEVGLKTTLETPLSLASIRQVAREVTVPREILMVMAQAHDIYMASRLKRKEDTELARRTDPASHPNYYLPAASPSNRTFVALVDQFKARIVLEQALAGTPYRQLRREAQMADIAHFFEGMGYWGPFTIRAEYAANGLVQIVADTRVLDTRVASRNINLRNKAQLTEMQGEVSDFVAACNAVIQTFVLQYRDVIAEHPHLFPTLFGSDEARTNWLNQRRSTNP